MSCEVEFDNLVTQGKLEELKLRHPAVGTAYRLGMYFDTVNSLPRGFDALPENDGYSSYFEETDFEDDGLEDLMFSKIPGDSASVVDMEVAEQVLLSRVSKKRICHAMNYRPGGYCYKFHNPGLPLEDGSHASRMIYNKNSIYTATSSGYGTALLSPQSMSQPEYSPSYGQSMSQPEFGAWNSFESQNSPNSQNSNSQGSSRKTADDTVVKSTYRSKPLPPTPMDLVQSPSRSAVAEDKPPFSRKKLYDIRQNKPAMCAPKNPLQVHKFSGSVQTLGSQTSVISGDYSRPWDLKKSAVAKGTSVSNAHQQKSASKLTTRLSQVKLQHDTSMQMVRSSSIGAVVHSSKSPMSSSYKRQFGKYLEYEPEHIYESITDVDNDYEEIDDELPTPSVRGLNQKMHCLNMENSSPSKPTTVVPLSAVSSSGKLGKKSKSDKSLKKSTKSNSTAVSVTTHTNSDAFGSIRKKSQGKRRSTFPDTTLAKCGNKPRGNSQPEIINYGIV